jgi:integrase
MSRSFKEWAEIQLSTHSARATAITKLLNAGVDLNTTRKFARHSTVQSTLRYDRRANDVLIEAAEKIIYN